MPRDRDPTSRPEYPILLNRLAAFDKQSERYDLLNRLVLDDNADNSKKRVAESVINASYVADDHLSRLTVDLASSALDTPEARAARIEELRAARDAAKEALKQDIEATGDADVDMEAE